ncbi:MAG: nitrite reductase (NAD(P)H) small subunit, partial [Planctomycetaceae bacterium]|nr:nitrite reductase (NAD(P)H) small subunit [Planctomycetaceae bacterium]
WYASQNMCPHKRAFVLSRGLTGDANGTPKISCPMHKKNFSLETGSCLSDERYSVAVFPVKVEGESVFVELPPSTELDQSLATDRFADMSCEVQTV